MNLEGRYVEVVGDKWGEAGDECDDDVFFTCIKLLKIKFKGL